MIGFNFTKGSGVDVVVTIFEHSIPVEPDGPVRAFYGKVTSRATMHVSISDEPLDPRELRVILGDKEGNVAFSLLFILTELFKYTSERADEILRDIELELAMNTINYAAADET